jgi:hypothetical protein
MVDNEWFISNIQKCKEILGEEKIYSLLRKSDPTRQSKLVVLERTNPLLFKVFLADKQIRESHGTTLPMTNELIQLANLGDNLTILFENSVSGLTEKISDLFTAKFEKTMYEITIAATFIKNGFNLEFIPETTEKTPDILIHLNKGIEVECKKKDDLTPRDRQNDSYWKQFAKNTFSQMDRERKNLIIILETDDNPKNSDLPIIIKKSGEIIKEITDQKIVYEGNGFKITFKQTEPYGEIISSSIFKTGEYYRSCGIYDEVKELDWEYNGTDFMALDNGTVQQKNHRLIGCKSKIMPDRITSIQQSIEKATRQLSGNKPGLIFIDHNILERDMAETDLSRLQPLINKIIKNNSKISGVVITQVHIFHEPMGTTYYHKAHLFINPSPKNPLPDDIKLMMNTF